MKHTLSVPFKRLDEIPDPGFQTKGAVAFDLAAAEDTTIQPLQMALVPTGLVIGVPQDSALLIFARSSLFKRTGLMLANSVGVIDRDYCGDDDEIKVALWNTSNATRLIGRGDRIAQGMFVLTREVYFNEVSTIKEVSRGGFGSTGVR